MERADTTHSHTELAAIAGPILAINAISFRAPSLR